MEKPRDKAVFQLSCIQVLESSGLPFCPTHNSSFLSWLHEGASSTEARWLLPAPGHILQCSNAWGKSGLQKSSGWLTILEPITVTLVDQVWVTCPVQSSRGVSDLLIVWVEADLKVKGCCDFQGRPHREDGTSAETWGRGEWLLGFAPEELEGVRITFYWGGTAVEELVWVWGWRSLKPPGEVRTVQGSTLWGLCSWAP